MVKKGVGKARPSRPPFLLGIVPALLILLAVGNRLLHPTPDREDDAAQRAAKALVGGELDHLRQNMNRKNEHQASRSAEKFVRAGLLPPEAPAHFPEPTLTVTRLRPHRYRVRGQVAWRDNHGQEQRRNFETDLQLGPADAVWRLIDTEFLP